MKTIAQELAQAMDNDGQDFSNFDMIFDLVELDMTDGDLTRYEFADGSAIVAGENYWDIEGETLYSFDSA